MSVDTENGVEHRSEKLYLHEVCDERWRYRCPSCGSTVLVIRKKISHKDSYLEYDQLTPRQHSHSGYQVSIKDFRCNECAATFDDPCDVKEDRRRRLRGEYDSVGGWT
jgi:DNA-directed RNA polymerase subunit RPC12/RpoP